MGLRQLIKDARMEREFRKKMSAESVEAEEAVARKSVLDKYRELRTNVRKEAPKVNTGGRLKIRSGATKHVETDYERYQNRERKKRSILPYK